MTRIIKAIFAGLLVAISGGFAESDVFVFNHPDGELVREIKPFAESVHAYYCRLFDYKGLTSSLTFHLFSDDESWKRFLQKNDLIPEGVALHKDREIYINIAAAQKNHPDELAHEMVHVLLKEQFGEIPLWLDEGLSLHYGWKFAKKYYAKTGKKLYRTLPALHVQDVFTLNELVDLKKYPKNSDQLTAFYREAEELVALLLGKHGEYVMKDFLTEPDRQDVLLFLQKKWKYTGDDLKALNKRLGENVQENKKIF